MKNMPLINSVCSNLMPLSKVRPGKKVKLVDFTGGRKLRAHLHAMGMGLGVNISVISNMQTGPVILSISETRISLGRGMAEKILVKPSG